MYVKCGIPYIQPQTVHTVRTASERKDDVEDEHGNVIEYSGQLFHYSLTPGTNTKYMTTIEQCRVNSSPNTLQAILGEL